MRTIRIDHLRVRIDRDNINDTGIVGLASCCRPRRLLQANFLNDRRLPETSARSYSASVLNEEDLVGWRVPKNDERSGMWSKLCIPDSCFVVQWVGTSICDEGEAGIFADDGVE
jgi:hypothetical protein